MIEFKKCGGKNFFKERASKAGALAYQTQINRILRSPMEGKESVDAKTPAQDDRFIRAWQNA
jgi:hypothetical protein